MFSHLIEPLIKLTIAAGAEIMSLYKGDIKITTKIDQTALTLADKAANEIIIAGLKKLTPNIPIISEESEQAPFVQRSSWDEYWLVDPLDGTHDFIDESGEFCICIAYIKNKSPVFGMIYAPITKTHYYASASTGAIKLQNNNKTKLIAKQKSFITKIVIGNYSANNENLKIHLQQQQKYTLATHGSALKFCLIAEGVYDYYPKFGKCYEWDVAAGECILQIAGGKVLDFNNKPMQYNTKDDLIVDGFFALGVSE